MQWYRLLVAGWTLQTAFVVCHYRRRYVAAMLGKASAAMCFVVLALWFSASCPRQDFAMPVCCGLAAGMCGDILLAARYTLPRLRRPLLVTGASIFFIGQVLYIIAVLRLAPRAALYGIPFVVVGLVVVFFYARRNRADAGGLKLPGTLYLASVWFMAGCALGGAVLSGERALWLFFAAGLMFACSDSILVVHEFAARIRAFRPALLLGLYYAAQTSIAVSVLLL